jgi:hypothetical protein
MNSTRYTDDDLGPEEKALAEHLRQRAQHMGCECRPGIHHNPVTNVVALEHLPSCAALRHPEANAGVVN